MFSIGTLALTAAFTNAFIAEMQPDNENPYQAPWLVVVVIAAVISFLLAGRDIRLLAKILLAIEGIGILCHGRAGHRDLREGRCAVDGYRLLRVLLLR